jgi:nitrogen fixation NifU-like protein
MALDYTDKVIELFRNPKNVGEIENPSVEVKEGSPACGDIIQVQMKIDKDNKIQDIKFKSFGCASNIATASMATEMVKGKHIDEAEKITWKDITKELGGLPSVKIHCSVLAIDAIQQAVDKYKIQKGLRKITKDKINKDFIIDKLRHVIDPSVGTDIIRLKEVLYVRVDKKGDKADVLIELTHPEEREFESNIKQEIEEKLEFIPGIGKIQVEFKDHAPNPKSPKGI